jgi:hypothetical protein
VVANPKNTKLRLLHNFEFVYKITFGGTPNAVKVYKITFGGTPNVVKIVFGVPPNTYRPIKSEIV